MHCTKLSIIIWTGGFVKYTGINSMCLYKTSAFIYKLYTYNGLESTLSVFNQSYENDLAMSTISEID